MNNYRFKNWSWLRIARLSFAIYMAYKGYVTGDVMYYMIGGLLGYQAILNIKCLTGTCKDDSCSIPVKTSKDETK